MSERIEHDSMGEVRVPADALWGAQTARAVENFPISGLTIAPADRARPGPDQGRRRPGQRRAGCPGRRPGRRDRGGGAEVAAGRHDEHFPIDVFQTGSGTSTNMNVNEVVARLAHLQSGRDVHPNDHVNAVAVLQRHVPDRDPARRHDRRGAGAGAGAGAPGGVLRRKEAEFAAVVKAGRTHLMDAVPVTLGQEFAGYARQVELGATARVLQAADGAAELPLGGTAAGTGLNAAPGFAAAVIAALAEETGIALREADNHFEAQATQDALVELSAAPPRSSRSA